MEAIEDIIELKLQGGGVKPQTLKAKELAELIESLEEALLHLVIRDHPEIIKEEIFISLVDIQDNSADLRFLPKLKDIIVAGFLTIATSIETGNFANLPIKTIDNLKVIAKFAKRRNCDAEFRLDDNTYGVIHPSTIIEIPKSAYIQGYTTIYPTVRRAGGKEPTVTLQLSDQSNDFLYVKATQEITKKLGEQLYSVVGLSGFAKWERETLKLVEFKIDQILEYKRTSIKKSFENVSNVLGKYYDAIDDVNQILSRDNDPDEE